MARTFDRNIEFKFTTNPEDISWTSVVGTDSSTADGSGYISSIVGDATVWSSGGPVTLERLKEVLANCIVCQEPAFILCDTCQSAVLQARKNMLQSMLTDLMEMEGKDDMKLHQGFTNTGSLTHAVVLIKRGEYEKRALCGVRVMETTARYFSGAEQQCNRCKNSAAKSA